MAAAEVLEACVDDVLVFVMDEDVKGFEVESCDEDLEEIMVDELLS